MAVGLELRLSLANGPDSGRKRGEGVAGASAPGMIALECTVSAMNRSVDILMVWGLMYCLTARHLHLCRAVTSSPRSDVFLGWCRSPHVRASSQ